MTTIKAEVVAFFAYLVELSTNAEPLDIEVFVEETKVVSIELAMDITVQVQVFVNIAGYARDEEGLLAYNSIGNFKRAMTEISKGATANYFLKVMALLHFDFVALGDEKVYNPNCCCEEVEEKAFDCRNAKAIC
jgi:hypothetical protein